MENNIKIIELLVAEKPMFHLRSATQDMPNVEDFLFKKGSTNTSGFSRTSYAIEEDVLNYISSIVKPESVTIETGGGYSTIVFASKSRKHICVNPDTTANELVKNWLLSKGFSCDNLYFIEESSDRGLANLELADQIDVGLIDGSHSFPFPIIDWHFIDGFLGIGSKLLIDDTQMNSVRIIRDFLLLEKSYKEVDVIGRCAVFEKVKEKRTMGWLTQERIMGRDNQPKEINKKNIFLLLDQESKQHSNHLRKFLGNSLKKILPTSLYQSLQKYYRAL